MAAALAANPQIIARIFAQNSFFGMTPSEP